MVTVSVKPEEEIHLQRCGGGWGSHMEGLQEEKRTTWKDDEGYVVAGLDEGKGYSCVDAKSSKILRPKAVAQEGYWALVLHESAILLYGAGRWKKGVCRTLGGRLRIE